MYLLKIEGKMGKEFVNKATKNELESPFLKRVTMTKGEHVSGSSFWLNRYTFYSTTKEVFINDVMQLGEGGLWLCDTSK